MWDGKKDRYNNRYFSTQKYYTAFYKNKRIDRLRKLLLTPAVERRTDGSLTPGVVQCVTPGHSFLNRSQSGSKDQPTGIGKGTLSSVQRPHV